MLRLKVITGLLPLFLVPGLPSTSAIIQKRDERCGSDNCLRALRNQTRSSDSHGFCSAYISLNTANATITRTSLVNAPLTTTTALLLTTITLTTTETAVEEEIVTKTILITLPSVVSIRLRDAVPTVPKYLSACSASSSRLSSACACYIGTTADLSSTDVVPTTITTTRVATLSTTATIVSVSTATQACRGNIESLSTVLLRIEGKSDTICEGTVTNGPGNLTTASGGMHFCDGTNNGANALPGATCTTALDEAACEKGFSWDGTWFSQFSDYFVTSIGNSVQTDTEFWGFLLNYQFTPVGGCQQQTKANDNVLWAYNAFNMVHFLQASTESDFSTTIGATVPESLISVYVRDGSSNSSIEGALIGGVITDARGNAVLHITTSGIYNFKATKADSLRSNAITVIVQ